jgi:hypothetical protein
MSGCDNSEMNESLPTLDAYQQIDPEKVKRTLTDINKKTVNSREFVNALNLVIYLPELLFDLEVYRGLRKALVSFKIHRRDVRQRVEFLSEFIKMIFIIPYSNSRWSRSNLLDEYVDYIDGRALTTELVEDVVEFFGELIEMNPK